MSLESYIQGQRRGSAINHLEKEAMQDPFLCDALEGYDTVKGDHIRQVRELQGQFEKQSPTANKNSVKIIMIVLAILLLGGTAAYFYLNPESFPVEKPYNEIPEIEEVLPPVVIPADTLSVQDTIKQVNTGVKRVYKAPVENRNIESSILPEIPKPIGKTDSLEVSF